MGFSSPAWKILSSNKFEKNQFWPKILQMTSKFLEAPNMCVFVKNENCKKWEGERLRQKEERDRKWEGKGDKRERDREVKREEKRR